MVFSPGIYCCGPVPVSAIKDGELTVKYDAPFVYAEVNADVVTMVRLKDGRTVKLDGNTTEVGHHISTKAVGKDERHDITNLYKYPEGKIKKMVPCYIILFPVPVYITIALLL